MFRFDFEKKYQVESNMKISNLLVGCLALLLIGLAVCLIKPWGQFPLNDDWVYTANVFETIRNGRFTVPYGQSAWAIPQILIGVLLGALTSMSNASLRSIGLVAGVLAAFFTVVVAEDCLTVPQSRKLKTVIRILGFCCVFFYPAFLNVSFSFMTDPLALLFLCLGVLSGGYYVKKRSWSSWAIALFFHLCGVAQRQFLFLLTFATIFVYLEKNGYLSKLRSSSRVLNCTLKEVFQLSLFLLSAPLIQLWWKKVSPVSMAELELLPDFQLLQRPYEYLIYLGFACCPMLFLPCYKIRDIQNKGQKIFGRINFGVMFITAALVIWGYGMPFYNNLLSKFGFLGVNEVLLGAREEAIKMPIRVLLTFLSLSGACRLLLGGELFCSDLKKSDRIKILFLFSTLYFLVLVVRNGHFDRYLILLIPAGLCLAFRTISSVDLNLKQLFGTTVLLIFYFMFSTTFLSDYFRWNEARWKTIDLAIGKYSIKREDLNGGYEFCGPIERKPWSWTNPKSYSYLISFSKLPEFTVKDKVSYFSYWGEHTKFMYLLERQ